MVALFGGHYNIPLIHRDACKLFLGRLDGVSDPNRSARSSAPASLRCSRKRQTASRAPPFSPRGRSTPTSSRASPAAGGDAVTIKSHHNVGGLPEHMKLELVEPLRELFKDEVRELGRELGLPESLVGRHPFRGRGWRSACPARSRLTGWTSFAPPTASISTRSAGPASMTRSGRPSPVLLPVRTVGVMGDARSYEYVCALRAVTSSDGMTADSYPFSHEFLSRAATRIVNEVKGVNRVVYRRHLEAAEGTIEWE